MAANERSISEIFQDIVRDIQEIIRSEFRLAKTEIREEATKAKSAGLFIAIGAVTAIFAIIFVLLTIVDALSLVMPYWAATLIVAVSLMIAAAAAIGSGIKQFKRIHPTPERTVESLKENVEWAKHQSK